VVGGSTRQERVLDNGSSTRRRALSAPRVRAARSAGSSPPVAAVLNVARFGAEPGLRLSAPRRSAARERPPLPLLLRRRRGVVVDHQPAAVAPLEDGRPERGVGHLAVRRPAAHGRDAHDQGAALPDAHLRVAQVTENSVKRANTTSTLRRTASQPTAGARACGPVGWIIMGSASRDHSASMARMSRADSAA
jgi:hypothetical protein